MSSDLLIMSGGSGGGSAPGGSTGDIQFNNGGVLGGETLVPLAHGGTNADLSASGSATAILAQNGSHVVSARNLVSADIPTTLSSLAEIDIDTIKLDHSAKDIVLSRSAAASLSIVGSPSVKGSYSGTQLSTPATPTITPTSGLSSTWGYKVAARDALGTTIASAEGTTTTGASSLDGTHFNTITWAAITGAVSYDIYRTTTNNSGSGPTTKGKIGNVLADAALSFVDNAVAADGTTPPTIATTGIVSCAPAGSASGDGAYMWAMDVDDQQAGATNTIISPGGANQVLVFMFVCRRTITIRKVVFMNGTTVVASSSANFGLYDINKNLILDSGPFSTAVASQTLSNTLASPVTIYAGEIYYYTMASSNATVTGICNYAWNTNSATIARNKNIVRSGTAANALSSAVLPATLGTLTGITNRVPVLVLFES